MHTSKRAQGLPITTIILAILGLVVLVILFAITTGRLAIFGRGVSECPGRCAGPHVIAQLGAPPGGGAPGASGTCYDTEKRLGTQDQYVLAGQGKGVTPDRLEYCNECCVPIG